MNTRSFLFLVIVAAGPLQAAFINGVEDFSGTVPDTSTWYQYVQSPTTFVWNNQLTMDANDALDAWGEYNTNVPGGVQIGIGEGVRVALAPLEKDDSFAQAGIAITNDSNHGSGPSYSGTFWLGLMFLNDRIEMQPGENDYVSLGLLPATLVADTHPDDTTYVYEIFRVSNTQTMFTIYSDTSLATVLGQDTFTHNSIAAYETYITLTGRNAVVDYYSVTIVPEPASVVLLAGSLLTFVIMRRRSTR